MGKSWYVAGNMVLHACKPGTLEADAEGWKFKASLGYIARLRNTKLKSEDLARWWKWSRRRNEPSASLLNRVVDLDQLLDMSHELLMQLYRVWKWQQLNRGCQQKQHSLLKRLCKVKKEGTTFGAARGGEDTPSGMVLLPEVVGSMVASAVARPSARWRWSQKWWTLPGRAFHHL